MPGEVGFGDLGDHLETLLGSCVAVILTNTRHTVGAMCHIVHCCDDDGVDRDNPACGPVALQMMLDGLMQRGVTPSRCVAYVYGGGNMFPKMDRNSRVGNNNANWVLSALCALNIQVVHVDLGGTVYRKLRWTVGKEAPSVTSTSV
jgi:chemotaxis protein CheD